MKTVNRLQDSEKLKEVRSALQENLNGIEEAEEFPSQALIGAEKKLKDVTIRLDALTENVKKLEKEIRGKQTKLGEIDQMLADKQIELKKLLLQLAKTQGPGSGSSAPPPTTSSGLSIGLSIGGVVLILGAGIAVWYYKTQNSSTKRPEARPRGIRRRKNQHPKSSRRRINRKRISKKDTELKKGAARNLLAA
jgi:hypothetical protein